MLITVYFTINIFIYNIVHHNKLNVKYCVHKILTLRRYLSGISDYDDI